MPFNGAGQFNRTDGTRTGANVWAQAKAAGVKIVKEHHDTHDEDLASGIEACLARDGQNAMAANLPMGGFRLTGLGSGLLRTDGFTVAQHQDGALIWGGTVGGTANALTAALSPAITAYVEGMRVGVVAATDNTGAATINLGGGAVALESKVGVPVKRNEIQAGAILELRYISTTPGFVVVSGLEIGLPTGTVQQYFGTTAPDGWLLLNGGLLGSAASGGSKASDDHEALFLLMWASFADAEAAVSSGRGASAAADWAANKTITVPDMRGRVAIGSGTGAGLTARTHGDTGGAETPTTSAAGANDAYQDGGEDGANEAHTHTVSAMQPWLALNYIVKI